MNIQISNTQNDVALDNDAIRLIVKKTLHHLGYHTSFIEFTFLSEEDITNIHSQIFKKSTPTDCITLPIDYPVLMSEFLPPDHTLGECFICPLVAKQQSDELNTSVQHEIALYIIHCILHMLGHEDTTEQKKISMTTKEIECLALFDTREINKVTR